MYNLTCNYFSRVLVFPPVDNYHRLLIHKTVEEFLELHSFSIGEGEDRRTVVCRQERLLRSDYDRLEHFVDILLLRPCCL